MSFWCIQFTLKNEQKKSLIIVKLNSFVRFLEETSAWKNHFDFFWPLLYIPASSIVASLMLKVWSSHWSSGVTSIENRAKFLSAESILVSSKSSSPSPNFRKKKNHVAFPTDFQCQLFFKNWFDLSILE